MSDIKQIQVSGEALSSLTGTIKHGGRSRRKTRKVVGLPVRAVEALENQDNHEYDEINNTKNTFNFIKHDTHIIPDNNVNTLNTNTNVHINTHTKQVKPREEDNSYQNNTITKEKVQIVLAPKKKKEHRVILSRKRKNINIAPVIGGSKHKTRKVSFNLLKHKKRLTRAKKIFDESKKLSIDKIKKELIAKHIIKSTSKAPDSILRQIYNDALLVANKAL
jgi:hypothetical protein